MSRPTPGEKRRSEGITLAMTPQLHAIKQMFRTETGDKQYTTTVQDH